MRWLAGILLVLVACAPGGDLGPQLDTRPEPPSLIIDHADGTLSLRPWSFSWEYREGNGFAGVGADGAPPSPLPVVRSTSEIPAVFNFQFDWEITATVTAQDGSCAPFQIDDVAARDWAFEELGPAGGYTMEFLARGDRGDASWTIDMQNETDLPYPEKVSC